MAGFLKLRQYPKSKQKAPPERAHLEDENEGCGCRKRRCAREHFPNRRGACSVQRRRALSARARCSRSTPHNRSVMSLTTCFGHAHRQSRLLIFRYFLRYFSSTHRTDLSRFRGTFHSFDPVGFAIFAIPAGARRHPLLMSQPAAILGGARCATAVVPRRRILARPLIAPWGR
jgi:hypothetical protein